MDFKTYNNYFLFHILYRINNQCFVAEVTFQVISGFLHISIQELIRKEDLCISQIKKNTTISRYLRLIQKKLSTYIKISILTYCENLQEKWKLVPEKNLNCCLNVTEKFSVFKKRETFF